MGDALDHRMLDRHAYAIVSAPQRDQVPPGIPLLSLARGVLTESADVLPSLISLNQLSAKQRGTVLDLLDAQRAAAESPVFCGLLSADGSIDRVQNHLSRIQVLLGIDGERGWLRVHDPQVWLQMPRIFSTETLYRLFGPVTAWSVCLRGAWIETHRPSLDARAGGAYRCTAEEWAALVRVGIVNRVLVRLGLVTHEQLLRHSPLLDALALRGQTRHQINRIEDIVDYVCLGWRIHPRFDEHPIALHALQQQELAQREVGGEAVADACAVDALLGIDPTHWPRMRDELETAYL